MFLVQNKSKCVFCIGDKHIIPGGNFVELTDDEANHPIVQSHVNAGELELTEVEGVEGVGVADGSIGKTKAKSKSGE